MNNCQLISFLNKHLNRDMTQEIARCVKEIEERNYQEKMSELRTKFKRATVFENGKINSGRLEKIINLTENEDKTRYVITSVRNKKEFKKYKTKVYSDVDDDHETMEHCQMDRAELNRTWRDVEYVSPFISVVKYTSRTYNEGITEKRIAL